ncbi:inner-membrane translocator (plasmid) [Rhizobium leguminosarum bv. trifolii WSM2304]|uniref:Inner-membrane translocator n=1 Tax=Rhizobium leguminosarum bv. trifolii (strain WSM2304) TaxID=395492 RepID=A0ABF7QZG8_RHILW|nr:ABC transporter permease [Rhizobium leguminosarum]ACI59625.1 inner-membrane translocator [Rhizobium leguminosarum bv. trifolii WSM2304]
MTKRGFLAAAGGVPFAITLGLLLGACVVALSGENPLNAYLEMATGALAPVNLVDTLAWATPVAGMALAAAIPLRGGIVNLGGDGQLVIGGFSAAVVAVYVPGPPLLVTTAAILCACVLAGVYSAATVFGETRLRIPVLISSLLLSYPAIAATYYLAAFPLRDTTTGLAQTLAVPLDVRLSVLSGPVSTGSVLVLVVAILAVLAERFTTWGYELRMRGLNKRFAIYSGIEDEPQAIRAMFISGAIAGLVGAVIVLGSHYRFQNGALITPGYTWSGLMAALLSKGNPLFALLSGIFFAALQTGGFAMQRETQIPRVLSNILQSFIILFLAMRQGLVRRRTP